VAHEINNQMTVVLGLGEFVRQDLGPDHPCVPDLDGIIAAGERAAHVTRQLLAFGRRQLISPQHLAVQQLAEELAPVLSRLVGEDKALVLEAEGASAAVRADPAQIEQILINLVANARDAMASGGRVTIATRDATLTPADAREHPADDVLPGRYVLIAVSDTGRGMDASTLAQIFEPFYTTKPLGEGTGLGLSTVHGIVKQHGGQVWVSSEVGVGTTVRVYLPAADRRAIVEPSETGVPAKPAAQVRPAAVLVVEDEPSVRGLARRTLEAAGISVMEAENGRHAWDLLAVSAGPPGLVLADLMMPDMNGRELGEAIAREWPEVPVLYTSAYSGADMVARGMLPTDAPFLQKPFTSDELVGRVSELLRPAPRVSGASARGASPARDD
jgi:CheY-like chemotaxis protein